MDDNPYRPPRFAVHQPREEPWLERLVVTVLFMIGLPIAGLIACILAVWIAIAIAQALLM